VTKRLINISVKTAKAHPTFMQPFSSQPPKLIV